MLVFPLSFELWALSFSRSVMPRNRTRPTLYALFFLSGVAALGCQIAWAKMFATGLGHEMPAVLAVVCAVLGGMALGAAKLDHIICRSHRPGRWYAWLEILIAAWSCFSVVIIPQINEAALKLIGLDPSPLHHWTIAFALPFLVLLPATAAMGATLPAMERFVSPLVRDGRCLGALYAANTLGAVTGVVSSAFIVVPALGLSRSVCLLAQVNLVCGVVALFLGTPTSSPACLSSPPATKPNGSSALRLGVTVFLTGLLGIGYEVVGVRILSQVLENTVYTFAASLAVFLLATSLGAVVYQRWWRGAKQSSALASLLGAISFACLLGMFALTRAQRIYDVCRDTFGDMITGVFAAEMTTSAVIFALPAFFMGATFSHLLQLSRRPDGGVGKAAAWNTLGGALAPVLFGVCLLPLLGGKWALVLIALGYLVLLPEISRWRWLVPTATVAFAFTLPANLRLVQIPTGGNLREFREGVMESVAVIEDAGGQRTLRVNNRFQMGGTAAAGKEYLQAHIPLLLHPDPKRALFLGAGTGITLGAATVHPNLQSDGVELVPEVVAVMPEFEPHNFMVGRASSRAGSSAASPHPITIYVADARRFVRATTNQYDAIVADLFHPARDGAGSLYTVEHFEALRARLAPGGLACQWLPLYQLDEPTLKTIVATFLKVFPHAQGWLLQMNVDTPVVGLVGSLKPRQYAEDWVERRLNSASLGKELKKLALADSVRFFGNYIAGNEALKRFAGGAPLNTDDQPRVTFGAPRFVYQRTAISYGRLQILMELDAGKSPALDLGERSGEFAARLSDYRHARDVYLRGLIADAEGKHSQAIDDYIESARLSEDFTAGYAQCLTLASLQAKDNPAAAAALLRRLATAQPARTVAHEMLDRLGEK